MTKKSYKKKEDVVEKKPFAEEVAERLIAALEKGTAPWQKPWKAGEPNGLLPYNPTTNKRYRGINSLMLMSAGFTDTRWMTFKQALDAGASLRKGSKGTRIQYWSFTKSTTRKGEDGKTIKDGDGKSVTDTHKLSRPLVSHATVFNAEQIDGLPELASKPAPLEGWAQLERAEKIVAASGAKIAHDQEDRAFYTVVADKIHMPTRACFPTSADYYATLLHEIGHWSGHKSRLDRDLTGSFGSESYAKEELRAEIASMILGDELGIGHNPDQHASYVASWIKTLRQDPLEIFRAAKDAEKIHDFILGFENDLNNEVANEIVHEVDYSDPSL
jgi:putative DNA primase/helicase